MADFFKGLAGGFGTGLQFGQAMQQRQERERQMQMRDDLAQESGRYGVTEGAYGPGLQENITQLQGLREQDPAQAPAYDQAIRELTRRQGLTAPDYSVASGATNYGTRQEARQAAAPMRAEGLAGVYRQYGDVTKADELEARAFDQQRGIAREARDVQDFATRQAAAQQQGLLTGAQITEAQSRAGRTKILDEARTVSQKIIDDRIAKTGATQLGPDDYSAAEQAQIQFLQTKGYGDEADKIVSSRNARIRDQITTESTQAQQAISAAISSNNLDMLGKAYDRFVHDGAKVVKVREGEDGKIYIDRVLDNGGEVEPVVFKNRQELFAASENLTKPGTLLAYSQTQFDNNLRSAAAETQKTQFAEKLQISKAELDLSSKRYNISAAQLDLARKEADRKTLGGQIKELEGALGVRLSDADKKSLGGIKDTDPLLKAELEVITGIAKSDGANPKTLESLPGQIQAAMGRSQARTETKSIVATLKEADKKGDGDKALAELRKKPGATEAIVAALAAQAGISYTPPPAAPAAPAAPARPVGLAPQSTSQQKYGMLTPIATIEADARAGNPDAIAYLDYLRGRERVRDENARTALE
jgi:hypothetical protein